MNYKPFVSWGVYGGTTAAERANYFASWGVLSPMGSTGGTTTNRYLNSFMAIGRDLIIALSAIAENAISFMPDGRLVQKIKNRLFMRL